MLGCDLLKGHFKILYSCIIINSIIKLYCSRPLAFLSISTSGNISGTSAASTASTTTATADTTTATDTTTTAATTNVGLHSLQCFSFLAHSYTSCISYRSVISLQSRYLCLRIAGCYSVSA